MKKRTVVLTSALVSLFAAAVVLNACKDNVYTMLDDYNSHFMPAEDEIPDPKPGDEGFEPSRMLRDKYDIYDNETLNLFGPNDCASYSWTIKNPFIKHEIDDNGNTITYDVGKPVELDFSNSDYNAKSQRFVLIPSKHGLDLGVYILELAVTDSSNNVYKDSCKLNINMHID